MARLLAALAGLILLAGCSLTEKFATFETVLTDPAGERYTVCTKHGARAVWKESTAGHQVEIEVDDRGLPAQPGWFSNLLTIAGARALDAD